MKEAATRSALATEVDQNKALTDFPIEIIIKYQARNSQWIILKL